MTIPDATRAVRTWWVPVAIVFLTAVIAFNYALLIPALKKGASARERQQAVYPVSLKLYVDAERRGVITAVELDCFRFSSRCPPPMKP